MAVTMMVALRVGAHRQSIACSHVYAEFCKGLSVCSVGVARREGGSEVRRFLRRH